MMEVFKQEGEGWVKQEWSEEYEGFCVDFGDEGGRLGEVVMWEEVTEGLRCVFLMTFLEGCEVMGMGALETFAIDESIDLEGKQEACLIEMKGEKGEGKLEVVDGVDGRKFQMKIKWSGGL